MLEVFLELSYTAYLFSDVALKLENAIWIQSLIDCKESQLKSFNFNFYLLIVFTYF